eukprot:3379019-Pleurochrysis_carterae.AAC.7
MSLRMYERMYRRMYKRMCRRMFRQAHVRAHVRARARTHALARWSTPVRTASAHARALSIDAQDCIRGGVRTVRAHTSRKRSHTID